MLNPEERDNINIILSKIGEFVKRRRTALGWTQKELAFRSGRNPTTVSKLENGRNVTISTACRILYELGYIVKIRTEEDTIFKKDRLVLELIEIGVDEDVS